MKKFVVLWCFLALITLSCSKDYVCVCEAEVEDTVLVLSTEYRGLRKGEAEIEMTNCEDSTYCRWEELK